MSLMGVTGRLAAATTTLQSIAWAFFSGREIELAPRDGAGRHS
jgi:hypothetical protein